VATDRHGPHADHGKDLVIIQASHVGYNPDTKTFGTYCRLQTEANESSDSCVNIDISPRDGQMFPLTKCVPWAAYIQDGKGNHYTLEQADLTARLNEQNTGNPDQIDLEDAIHRMEEEHEIRIAV